MKLTKRGEAVLALGIVTAALLGAYMLWLAGHSMYMIWLLRGQYPVG